MSGMILENIIEYIPKLIGRISDKNDQVKMIKPKFSLKVVSTLLHYGLPIETYDNINELDLNEMDGLDNPIEIKPEKYEKFIKNEHDGRYFTFPEKIHINEEVREFNAFFREEVLIEVKNISDNIAYDVYFEVGNNKRKIADVLKEDEIIYVTLAVFIQAPNYSTIDSELFNLSNEDIGVLDTPTNEMNKKTSDWIFMVLSGTMKSNISVCFDSKLRKNHLNEFKISYNGSRIYTKNKSDDKGVYAPYVHFDVKSNS